MNVQTEAASTPSAASTGVSTRVVSARAKFNESLLMEIDISGRARDKLLGRGRRLPVCRNARQMAIERDRAVDEGRLVAGGKNTCALIDSRQQIHLPEIRSATLEEFGWRSAQQSK